MKKLLFVLALTLLLLFPVFAEDASLTSAEPAAESEPVQQESKANPQENVESTAENPYKLDSEGWWNELWTDARFSYDIYLRSTLLRGDYSVGGGLSLGVTTNRFRFEGYAQGDFFLSPMGNGYLSPLEFDIESGITLGWKMLEVGSFDVYIAGDIGYYVQFTRYHEPEDLFINENGFMLRAKLVTELPFWKYYGISLGVYYQTPIAPTYRDYSGFGIMISIA